MLSLAGKLEGLLLPLMGPRPPALFPGVSAPVSGFSLRTVHQAAGCLSSGEVRTWAPPLTVWVLSSEF